MHTSQELNEIAGALALAQKDVKGAVKDSTNPHFKSRFADLASVWEACRTALTTNGLAVAQTTEVAPDGSVNLNTTLFHKSGQFIGGTYPLRPVKDDPQGLGSSLTYARRYALAALVGVAPEDDDGESASGRGNSAGREQKKPDAPQAGVAPTRTRDQAAMNWATKVAKFRDHYGPDGIAYAERIENEVGEGESLEQFTTEKLDKCSSLLITKAKEWEEEGAAEPVKRGSGGR